MIIHLSIQYYVLYLEFSHSVAWHNSMTIARKMLWKKRCPPIHLYMFWLLLPLAFSTWLTRWHLIIGYLKHYILPQVMYFPQEIQHRFSFSSMLNTALSSLFNLRAETLFLKGQWATTETWGHFPCEQSRRQQTPHPATFLGILRCLWVIRL